MSIGGISGPYYVPVTPVAPVQASPRTPERRPDNRADEVEARRAPPSRPPPGQGRVVDIRA